MPRHQHQPSQVPHPSTPTTVVVANPPPPQHVIVTNRLHHPHVNPHSFYYQAPQQPTHDHPSSSHTYGKK